MVQNEQKKKRTHRGVVVSDKMDKTVVVEVERTYVHPLLAKVVRSKKKYKVHDENKQARMGDQVVISEGRPKSKTKYMYLERVIVPAAA